MIRAQRRFSAAGPCIAFRSITHLDELLELPAVSHRWLESMGWDHDGGKRLLTWRSGGI